MLSIVLLVISSLVVILLESSLMAWPWVLWSLWWWSLRLDWSRLVWLAVISGVVLDVGVGRTTGVGAIFLWIFVVGLMMIRTWLSIDSVGEKIWLIVASASWGYYFGGLRGVGALAVVVLASVVVIWGGRRIESGRDIRLRR